MIIITLTETKTLKYP